MAKRAGKRREYVPKHSSDKGERGMNSTQITYTLTGSIPRSAFRPWDTTLSHSHTPKYTHLFLQHFFSSSSSFLFERQIIAALSERMKANLEATRVSKQQKNENRCEKREKSEKETIKSTSKVESTNRIKKKKRRNFCNIFNNFLVKFPNRDYCYAI